MPYVEIDHTADVMFHVWGQSLCAVLEDAIKAMTSVLMGTTPTVFEVSLMKMQWLVQRRKQMLWRAMRQMRPQSMEEQMGELSLERNTDAESEDFTKFSFSVSAPTTEHLLYRILDEYLYVISGEDMCCIHTIVHKVEREISAENSVRCTMYCVPIQWISAFGGIEIKAVTLHNLRLDAPKVVSEAPSAETEDDEGKENMWNATFVLDI